MMRQIVAEGRRNLPKPIWDDLSGGAESEFTLLRNREALHRIGLRPRILRNVGEIDTATSLLGLPLSLPVFLAPIAPAYAFVDHVDDVTRNGFELAERARRDWGYEIDMDEPVPILVLHDVDAFASDHAFARSGASPSYAKRSG